MIGPFSGATPRVMGTQAFLDRYVIDNSPVRIGSELVQLWIVGLLPPDDIGFNMVKVAAQAVDSSDEGLICVAMRLAVFKSLMPLASLCDLPDNSGDIEFDELMFSEFSAGFRETHSPEATQEEALELEDRWSRGEQPVEGTINFLQRVAPEVPANAAHSYVHVLKMLHNGWLDEDDASVIIPALCRCLAEVLEPL